MSEDRPAYGNRIAPGSTRGVRCKCGKKIVFAKLSNGKTVPLDVVAPVYEVRTLTDGTVEAERSATAYVSHFATCPNAGDFSGGRKKA